MTFLVPAFPALPTLQMPTARQALYHATTVLLWAIALTFTLGRLSRRAFEAARPQLARLANVLSTWLYGPGPLTAAVATTHAEAARAMAARGMSQNAIAAQLGTTRSRVRRWLAS